MDVREILRTPVVVAPMAGGPSTPALIAATTEAGAFAFVAGGYLTADALQREIEAARAPFGVNLFVPSAPAPRAVVDAYVATLAADAERLGVALGEAAWNDDDWDAKLDVVRAARPAAVSFAFGCPAREVIDELRARDIAVVATVTTPDEIKAVAAGADALAVQGIEAGAHRGAFANDNEQYPLMELLAAAREITTVPLLAAGGIASADDVQRVLGAGAVGAQVGTAFVRCPESGAHPTYKAALADARFTETAITRAFSGRRARGLVNQFMRDHADAPAAYPEINAATRPLRAAAAAAGDPDRMSLWAGTGWRASTGRPAAEVVEMLVGGPRR